MGRLTLNGLLSLIFQAKKSGKGMVSSDYKPIFEISELKQYLSDSEIQEETQKYLSTTPQDKADKSLQAIVKYAFQDKESRAKEILQILNRIALPKQKYCLGLSANHPDKFSVTYSVFSNGLPCFYSEAIIGNQLVKECYYIDLETNKIDDLFNELMNKNK